VKAVAHHSQVRILPPGSSFRLSS